MPRWTSNLVDMLGYQTLSDASSTIVWLDGHQTKGMGTGRGIRAGDTFCGLGNLIYFIKKIGKEMMPRQTSNLVDARIDFHNWLHSNYIEKVMSIKNAGFQSVLDSIGCSG